MNPPTVASDKVRQLRGICGDDVRERPAGGVYVNPASPEEVAAVLAFADQHQLTVGPQGGSTERSASELRTDIVLHTSRLTEVEHYDHADLTVGIGAGTTIGVLWAACSPPAYTVLYATDTAVSAIIASEYAL